MQSILCLAMASFDASLEFLMAAISCLLFWAKTSWADSKKVMQ